MLVDPRDPAHARPWVALVDGNAHQIERIHAEADRRGLRVSVSWTSCRSWSTCGKRPGASTARATPPPRRGSPVTPSVSCMATRPPSPQRSAAGPPRSAWTGPGRRSRYPRRRPAGLPACQAPGTGQDLVAAALRERRPGRRSPRPRHRRLGPAPPPGRGHRQGRPGRAHRLGDQDRPAAAPAPGRPRARPAVPDRPRPRPGPPTRRRRPRPRQRACPAVLPAGSPAVPGRDRRVDPAPAPPLPVDPPGRSRGPATHPHGQEPPHQPDQPGRLRPAHLRRRRRRHRGTRPRPPALTPSHSRATSPDASRASHGLLRSLDRLVASARATATDRFCAATVARLDQGAADRLERLVADVDPTSPGPRQQELAELKADPDRASLETLFSEVDKLVEIYSRLALADAQQRYDQVITRFPV